MPELEDRIRTLQQIFRQVVAPEADLVLLTNDALQALLQKLENQLDRPPQFREPPATEAGRSKAGQLPSPLNESARARPIAVTFAIRGRESRLALCERTAFMSFRRAKGDKVAAMVRTPVSRSDVHFLTFARRF
ncbi:MAG: hypothetical protein ACKO2P_06375 [Planctomycetota bacterium]